MPDPAHACRPVPRYVDGETGERDARAEVLLLSLVVSGQIKLRSIDGRRKIAAMLSQHMGMAA